MNVHTIGTEHAQKNLYPYHGKPLVNLRLEKEYVIRYAMTVRRLGMMMAQIEIENPMTLDWWWNEIEYRVPSKARMKRERQAYEQAEREDKGNEYTV